jgi:hypothetical protein
VTVLQDVPFQDAPFNDNSPRWNPLRRELLKWFRDNAESLAEAYEGAIRLVDDGNFPGRIHFVAHAIRDISDRLVFVLDPQLKAGRVQYEYEMDRIEKLWPQFPSVQYTNYGAAQTETVPVERKVVSLIDSFVKAHRERRQRPSNHDLLFHFLMRKEPLQTEGNQRLVMEFKRTRDWFMRITHLRNKNLPMVDESELQTQFKKFEGMLHSFVGNFFTGKKEIDEILRQANK